MRISINEDLESSEFKENFFYHFTKRETGYLVAGLGVGGAIYALCVYVLGMPSEQTTLFMTVAVLPILMTGFFKYQGFSFIDFIRKYILTRLCASLHWQSTEDVGEIGSLRIKNIRIKPASGQTAGDNERRQRHGLKKET